MAKTKPRVLIVDDDRGVISAVGLVLENAGFAVSAAGDSSEALKRTFEDRPDLVLLDIGLPRGLEGFEVLKRLRDMTDVPIIMLTGRTAAADQARGLNDGADDYVIKPFDTQVLLARIRTQLRNRRRASAQRTQQVIDEHLTLDLASNRVFLNGAEVNLTPIEGRLLRRLVESEGQGVSFAELLRAGWGNDHYRDGRSVKVYVSTIRRKLKDSAHNSRYLHTERELGYRFEPLA